MNTIQTYVYRRKYRLATLDHTLRANLVAEQICNVDRSEGKYIDSPYGSKPTTVTQAIVGTYATAAYTLTDDTLTVADEFIVAEHVYDFEQMLTAFDVMDSRFKEQNYSVAEAIDKFVLNNLCEDGTGTYTTPTGGFTTAANILTILGNLQAQVAGYEAAYKDTFLVIENTDLPGFIISAASTGFQMADKTLANGFGGKKGSCLGTDIYVVRTGTFVSATLGTTTVTNAGHRVFGVKNVATYAAPRSIQYEEKSVAAKTGKECVTWGYIGFKLWAPKVTLVVDITLS
jgi:hypothetical protein